MNSEQDISPEGDVSRSGMSSDELATSSPISPTAQSEEEAQGLMPRKDAKECLYPIKKDGVKKTSIFSESRIKEIEEFLDINKETPAFSESRIKEIKEFIGINKEGNEPAFSESRIKEIKEFIGINKDISPEGDVSRSGMSSDELATSSPISPTAQSEEEAQGLMPRKDAKECLYPIKKDGVKKTSIFSESRIKEIEEFLDINKETPAFSESRIKEIKEFIGINKEGNVPAFSESRIKEIKEFIGINKDISPEGDVSRSGMSSDELATSSPISPTAQSEEEAQGLMPRKDAKECLYPIKKDGVKKTSIFSESRIKEIEEFLDINKETPAFSESRIKEIKEFIGINKEGNEPAFSESRIKEIKEFIGINKESDERAFSESGIKEKLTTNKSDEAKTATNPERKPNAKKKNAQKKPKQVKMPAASAGPDPNQTQFGPGMNNTIPNRPYVQDYYQNYSSPNYANTNSRYLENLTYHPQFQYQPHLPNQMNMQQTMQTVSMQQTIQAGAMTHTMQTAVVQQTVQSAGIQHTIQSTAVQHTRHSVGRQHSMQTAAMHSMQHRPHPASAPTTPLVMHQRPSTGSIPNSPNTGFYQNMMQHPLLSHTYVQSGFNTNAQSNINSPCTVRDLKETPDLKSSPNQKKNHNRNNKKNETDDKWFDTYMPAEEVEAGLKNNILLEGVLRINPKQFQYAYISTIDRDEQDIFIDGLKNRNRALEGDVVVVMLVEEDKSVTKEEENDQQENKSDLKEDTSDQNTEKSEQSEEKGDQKKDKKDQKRGKVVYIKEKVHTRTCIGNLKLMPDKSRQRALFVPRDHRVPRLNIPFTDWPDNFYQLSKRYEQTLFLAKIISWTDTRFAIGKIICNLGQSGDMKAETMAILAENDLDITPYGPEVRDLFPRLDYTIPEEEIKLREDCRNLCIFSIDPSNCRDIDDAVSCVELSNGNYEIGVHISDVAHYLTEGTLLDHKVSQKATTIYLVERAYHMLPEELCMLCSLFPGVDKLAFSVFWEITKDGEVLSHRFAKTVINSCSQLAYEHAQAILDNKEYSKNYFPETYNNYQYKDIRKSIEAIGRLSVIFRHNRFENGALRIDQPKVAFCLNPENGLPDSYLIYQMNESHQMIEEFMLLANMTVAQRIYEDHPKLAFLRCHPEPSGYMLKQLATALAPMGIDIDISSAGALHRSLLPYSEAAKCDKGKSLVLNMLCAKPMTRAKYFCADSCEDDDFRHYALNIPIYTHFTSPIRRYADIMVHRLLAASLKVCENPKWNVDKVRAVAAQCNKQKYNAKKAGEMSSDLYMLKYIELHTPIQTEAVVVEIREKYIDVIVLAMGLNRRVFFNADFPGEFNCIKHECGSIKMSKMEVTWPAKDDLPETKQTIEVFSILQLLLVKADDMVKVETKLVRP